MTLSVVSSNCQGLTFVVSSFVVPSGSVPKVRRDYTQSLLGDLPKFQPASNGTGSIMANTD